MSEFKREERYIVVKLSDIGKSRTRSLRDFLRDREIPTRECVVVESDWPIYEEAWDNIQRLAEGKRSINQEVMQLQTELKLSKGREQALAVRVGAGKAVIANLLEVEQGGDLDWVQQDAITEAVEWADGIPETSLARIKAQIAAEAISDAVAKLTMRNEQSGYDYVRSSDIEQVAVNLRRQAEDTGQ